MTGLHQCLKHGSSFATCFFVEVWVSKSLKRCCADYVNEVINNGIGKFLLFAHHRKMLDSLEAVLKERVGGGGYMRIDGSTPQRERADLVTRFQEERGKAT